jgi:TRAP transporter TAXI family solute receptor
VGHPLTAVPGAGGISNPARVARMPGDLAMSFLPFLRSAYRGERPYRQPHRELRHVATLIENKLHLLIADSLGITSLGDIRARELAVRIGTGPPGSGEEFLLREVLAFYGITYDDIGRWGGRIDLLGTSERADAWRDYHVELLVFTINEPASLVTELLLTRPARIWPVPADVGSALQESWGTSHARIGAGVYPNHDQPIDTVGLSAVIFGTDDVSGEITYALVRAIAEHREYLETVHPAFRAWDPKAMIANGGVPFHHGAERYYRERQWIEP